jgi:hypothetical protein
MLYETNRLEMLKKSILKGLFLSTLLSLFSLLVSAQDRVAADTSAAGSDAVRSFEDQFLKQSAGIQYDSLYVEKKLRERPQKLTAFGYYRLFVYQRNITQPYPGLAPFDRTLSVGDGYREPMLSLSVVARPNGKASFGTELFMFTPYDGSIEENTFATNLGLNFYGNFRTQHGNFGVRAGGIHWYNLSPFTMGVFQILDRFTIFDRTPWEGVSNMGKYDAYFQSGLTSAGDLRWNNQAFQGLIINGGRLPGDFAFDLMWGKTQPNGGLAGGLDPTMESFFPNTLDAGNVPTYFGFQGDQRYLPSIIQGGKLSKSFDGGRQNIAYNGFVSSTAIDSINTDSVRSYQVHTLSLDLNVADINISGELGAGRYYSSSLAEQLDWGEALMLRFKIPKKYTQIPIDLQVYRISKNFFNENGEIATNSNLDILNDRGLTVNANGAGGQMALVNQLVHNRQGVNLNTEINIGDVKLAGGIGWSSEIDPAANAVSFVHRINGLALSRIYNPFPAGVVGPVVFGPYNRKFSFFRGVSEVVETTDFDSETGRAVNRKFFGAVDLQGKYKTLLFDKELYFFYIGSFNSSSTALQPVPVYNEDTYVFVQYHELDFYYEVLPKFIVTGYYGIENARGGNATLWNEETGLPLDQINTAIGIGFDWQIAENSGLYVRHRWMSFEDRSFPDDRFKGTELTVELKTFF